MSSCVYDKVELETSDNIINPNEYSLAVTIDLPVMNTRSGEEANDWEKYEDYVKDFSLLFFKASKEGKELLPTNQTLIKKYDSSALTFFEVKEGTYGYMKQWYVRIPMDDADFIQQLREEDFKIAVLANWPKNVTIDDKININTLHHLVTDEIYSQSDVYKFLTDDNGKMGATTEWVKNNQFDKKEDATSWIRDHWNPSLEKNNPEDPSQCQYSNYNDLWFLWNFGGNADDNALPYGTSDTKYTMGDDIKGAWEQRNGSKLREWLTTQIREGENEGEITDNLNKDTADDDTSTDDDTDAGAGDDTNTGNDDTNTDVDSDNDKQNELVDKNVLSFITTEGAIAFREQSTEESSKYYYGVRLPVVQSTEPTDDEGSEKNEMQGAFSFIARASGTLYITGRAAESNQEALLTVQVGDADTKIEYALNFTDITTISKEISITGDEQRVYLYNSSGSNGGIDIFQIEYIQDEYLYETDRTGIMPSDKHPIPMYGIQKYKALGEVWKEGTVFDLSNFNYLTPTTDYDVHPIQLLRSVAKVELLLPEDGNFNHVFLRNMNRTAFSEPMDVASSTGDIWEDAETSSAHPADCEWSKLIGLEPFYPYNNVEDYQSKLSWYYYNSDRERFNNGSLGTSDSNIGNDHPHILNPHINSSDFVKFKEAGTNDDGLKRYVLYVPEKFVDDPDCTDENKAPKVCHIEFRAQDDPYYNLDDNNCYRIYFTEEGFYSKDGADPPAFKDAKDTWENEYENDLDILQHHWTIMRNHVYTFTVEYNPGGKLAVQVKVLPWKRRMIAVEW